ncbi:hypothetical protein ADUPG1_011874 [Aduncisulcus paluster]|uniref:Protein kinase domain-containing protein n=1 Tax=Aduncisulcus paluster TaxID=2918883 RepID=A0ABQ5JXL3_9EUKA|nr:hypothetical protein ADUPG1_011874 [Aduncisulcus paluster]
MNSSTSPEVEIRKPIFIHEGNNDCIPISRNDFTISMPDIPRISTGKGPVYYNFLEEREYSGDECSDDESRKSGDSMTNLSINARKIMRGQLQTGNFSNISIPFLFPTRIEAAYICISPLYTPRYLTFILTDFYKNTRRIEYEFPKVERSTWFLLPIRVCLGVLCEIEGLRWSLDPIFSIESLVFISEYNDKDSTKSSLSLKCLPISDLWISSTIVQAEIVKEEDVSSIPRDRPCVLNPSFKRINAFCDSLSPDTSEYDRSSEAQKMLKGGDFVSLSHLSIPFPSPSPMKGAYICVHKDFSSPSLLFTFTARYGKKTYKKYEFCGSKTELFSWYFLPIDLDNVFLCEIKGKGTWENKNSRSFSIHSLVFIRKEETSLPAPQTPDLGYLLCGMGTARSCSSIIPPLSQGIFRNLLKDLIIQFSDVIIPEFIHEGNEFCLPIPRDGPSIVNPDISKVRQSKMIYDEPRDSIYSNFDKLSEIDYLTFAVQGIFKGEDAKSMFHHLSIPFPSPSPIKGAYICVNVVSYVYESSTFKGSDILRFTFFLENGDFVSKNYFHLESICNSLPGDHDVCFPRPVWFFLPVDLTGVVLCEIDGMEKKLTKVGVFEILSISFVKDESPTEYSLRMSKIKYHSELPTTKAISFSSTNEQIESLKYQVPEDFYSISNYFRSNPDITFSFLFSMVKAKNDSKSINSEFYDMSLQAQSLLKGEEESCSFSHLSIPFSTPISLKGAIICLNLGTGPPKIFVSFTHSGGKKTMKKYEFTKLKKYFEWFFLPIDLPDVALCEIEGKGTWENENSRSFEIEFLYFVRRNYVYSVPQISSIIDGKPPSVPCPIAPIINSELKQTDDQHELPSIVPQEQPEDSVSFGEAVVVKIGNRKSPPICFSDLSVILPLYSELHAKIQRPMKNGISKPMVVPIQCLVQMLKGQAPVTVSDLFIPFSVAESIKGAYICVHQQLSAPSLLFIFSHSDGKNSQKKYRFCKPRKEYIWFYLPVDLTDVVHCHIHGSGRWKQRTSKRFTIESLIFTNKELVVSQPVIASKPEVKKPKKVVPPVISSVIPPVINPQQNGIVPMFVKSGGRKDIPIPRNDPRIVESIFNEKESKYFISLMRKEGVKQLPKATLQKFLNGSSKIACLRMTLPFHPSSMKGAYICINMALFTCSNPISLIFEFTASNGEKTSKKYKFTAPKGGFCWFFLPICLSNVVLCDIFSEVKSKQMCSNFSMESLVFMNNDDPKVESSPKIETNPKIESCKSIFLKYGTPSKCPISRKNPQIISMNHRLIVAKDKIKPKSVELKLQEVQKMLISGSGVAFSHLEIPFSSKTSIHGAFTCQVRTPNQSARILTFIFTHSNGTKTCKRYKVSFNSAKGKRKSSKLAYRWYFHPICLFDIVYCELQGTEILSSRRRKDHCVINSLMFVQNSPKMPVGLPQIPQWLITKSVPDPKIAPCSSVAEASKSLSSSSSSSLGPFSLSKSVSPVFVHTGPPLSLPLKKTNPQIVHPIIQNACAWIQKNGKKLEDKTADARAMLTGKGTVCTSYLSIPFSQPSSLKGVYTCLHKNKSASRFTFTFTHVKKTKKENSKISYCFKPLICVFEWYFLPIDLSDVTSCSIETNGCQIEPTSASTIYTLLFVRNGNPIQSMRALQTSSIPKPLSKPVKGTGHFIEDGKQDTIYTYKKQLNSFTIVSSKDITPQCIISNGRFGEILLLKVAGIPIPCILKKILSFADEKVVKGCRKEFKSQMKFYANPKCFKRILRPLYILDLLDADMKGVYGFVMEFCVGGSVSAFAKRWCADGKYVIQLKDEEEDSESSFLSDGQGCGPAGFDFDPMTLNPVKVCSLCVGMIECLDDVFTAKPNLVHGDIKPNNFLVRVDSKNGECAVVLSDIGILKIHDSISSSPFAKSFVSSSRSSTLFSAGSMRSEFESLVYNSYEALQGIQDQKTDAYSLGISILGLFLCCDPFLRMPTLRGISSKLEFVDSLMTLMEKDRLPKLLSSPLFSSLLTIDGGKFIPVYRILNEIFTGLTHRDHEKRITVNTARLLVTPIKYLLPSIGQGWKHPRIETIVSEQRKKYGGHVGKI